MEVCDVESNREPGGVRSSRPPSVLERYFTRWYKTDVKGKACEDHCVLQHSNRLCVITVAESHPLLCGGRDVAAVDYQISAGCSRLDNRVSGKSKRGGQFLTEFSPLCRITCTDGEQYTIYSCIRGRLVEVNENIIANPRLIRDKPSCEGYIAVVLPKFEESKIVTNSLRDHAEYLRVLAARAAAAAAGVAVCTAAAAATTTTGATVATATATITGVANPTATATGVANATTITSATVATATTSVTVATDAAVTVATASDDIATADTTASTADAADAATTATPRAAGPTDTEVSETDGSQTDVQDDACKSDVSKPESCTANTCVADASEIDAYKTGV